MVRHPLLLKFIHFKVVNHIWSSSTQRIKTVKIMAAFDKLFLFKPGWRVGVQDNYCKPFIAPVINDPVRLNIPHVNTLQLNKPFLFFFFEECNSSHFKKGWYIIIILLQSIRQMIITHFVVVVVWSVHDLFKQCKAKTTETHNSFVFIVSSFTESLFRGETIFG